MELTTVMDDSLLSGKWLPRMWRTILLQWRWLLLLKLYVRRILLVKVSIQKYLRILRMCTWRSMKELTLFSHLMLIWWESGWIITLPICPIDIIEISLRYCILATWMLCSIMGPCMMAQMIPRKRRYIWIISRRDLNCLLISTLRYSGHGWSTSSSMLWGRAQKGTKLSASVTTFPKVFTRVSCSSSNAFNPSSSNT